ncbi:aromatic ring-hydroxylating dioxygenase subunit alpha [Kaistia geumhonensis]|uniref:Phenylpropionate dioxygenase-like ring-hydroxylating dioxygenase large terminal subunit n=1 Tax=Kaistia geumhonensis TaxID=410839 RepID=A0ABU0M7K4_9HYPH|nr:aromatic ring-hydroxylating dioxygenase subunit alpha [Kaistia geumhonensis]MCX5477833.1 aromatic ring-hydroxylating dioxygenase subunit alpha [Kaistia geumhonensis]MDQ0516955.1 phenylpropionate dioxygenase-like ring-hydroxylating dioxygenase large terminal subunit [Kaistia geumhonensis]
MARPAEKASLDHWYVIDALQDIPAAPRPNRLLGRDLVVARDATETVIVRERLGDGSLGAPLPTHERWGYLWTTLGEPPRGLFEIPEADEPDRRHVVCGAVQVRASGLRIVENFLDMAHFPFVHTDILGAEPHTEVRHYTTEIRRDVDEVWATNCEFFQPQAALSASGGIMTQYMYRVAAPFQTLLYKTCPAAANRWDVICLFVQPLDHDRCRAHPVMFIVDDESTLTSMIHFQQLIFLQDRIILENQRPRLLPLEPRAEIPTRADMSSVAYRRWLKEKGVTFGTAERAA